MRLSLFDRNRHDLITSILLVALTFRALIPVGFMPAYDRPLSLIICRAGFATPLPAHALDPHPGRALRVEHCAFATAPATGPTTRPVTLRAPAPTVFEALFAPEPSLRGSHLERAQQPRAPPPFA